MDIILIAGLWLPVSVWDDVGTELEHLGHRPLGVSLPGVDDGSATATLGDQIDATLAVVDGATRPMVVGHSAASTLAWIIADREPDEIHSVVLIGGFPAGDGDNYADFFEAVDGVMPFPGWAPFEGPDSADLDEETRRRVAEAAVPVPEGVSKATVALTDERRFEVPVILVCPEYSPEDAKGWIESGEVPELEPVQNLSYVDIDSGHWPMVTRPAELARVLDAAAKRRSEQ